MCGGWLTALQRLHRVTPFLDQSPGWLPVSSHPLSSLHHQGLACLMGVLTALALLQLPASPHVVFWPALALSFVLDNCLSLWSQSPSCPLSPGKLDLKKQLLHLVTSSYLPSQNFCLICLLTFHTDKWGIVNRVPSVCMTHMFLKNMWRREERKN